MIFDDDTLDALGYGEALDLRRDVRDSDAAGYVVDRVDDANGRMTRAARGTVLVAHMTDEQRRAYWRAKKAAWRARRPDLDADAERRSRRLKGHRSMEVHLRRVAAAKRAPEARAEKKRKWRAADAERRRAERAALHAQRPSPREMRTSADPRVRDRASHIVSERVHDGWDRERAETTPVRPKRKRGTT